MTVLLLLLTVAAAQAYVVTESWVGVQAPDPVVCLAAFAGLYWPRRALPLAALALGWGRAAVLVEPAGGQILCAWVAVTVVAGQRGDSPSRSWTEYVAAALVTAAAWSLTGVVVRLVADVPLQAGLELFLGAIVAIPLARVARGAAHLTGWAAS